VSAVAAGTYDIAYATISTLAVAHARGLPFVLIAPGVGVKPGTIAGAIMVPPNSPIQSAKDFNGKTFGCVALNTIAEYLPRAWVDKHGGDSSTMKFVEVPFPEEVPAMTAGRIDACYLVEPFLTMSLKQKTAKLLTTGDDPFGPTYLATGWYTTAQWAKAHPDLVARFVGAMRQAAAWADANPAKVVPILVNELHVDPTVTAQANRAYFPPSIVPSAMQPWIDVTAHYARFAPFNATELIYTP
jgi:NitT/TauT family transport system substrate-binding protein